MAVTFTKLSTDIQSRYIFGFLFALKQCLHCEELGIMDGNVLCILDNLEAPAMETCNRGVKLSSITAKLKDSIDLTPLLGRFQQLGFVKIVYNPSVDDEPIVQITEKGKLQIIELLLSLQPTGK